MEFTYKLLFVCCSLSLLATHVGSTLTTSLLKEDKLANAQHELLKICPSDCTCNVTSQDIISIVVDCNERNLTYVPKFDENSGITKLDIGRNEIGELKPDTFDSYKYIEILLAYMNEIKTIDITVFSRLKNLNEIDLSDNLLFYIHPDTFKHNENLKSVILSGNALVEVSASSPILNAPRLTELDMSFCKLASLTPESFKNLNGIQKLDLSSNDLRTISLDTLQSMDKLKTVNLGNNRWTCGCNLTNLLSWITTVQKNNNMTPHRPVKCIPPGGGTRKTWTIGSISEKHCPSSESMSEGTKRCGRQKREQNDNTHCGRAVNKIETTDVKILPNIPILTTEMTIKSDLSSFLEHNSHLIFAGVLSVVVFTLVVLTSYLFVKRILRANNVAEQKNNNKKQNLILAFGGQQYTHKHGSSTPLLKFCSPEAIGSPTTTAPRQQVQNDQPPSLFYEYISSRPTEHVYEVVH